MEPIFCIAFNNYFSNHRLATERYQNPTENNLKNLYMHLTNYSVNKHSEMYVDHALFGSKR